MEFRDSIVIEKPAEHVYALVDWADPRNALRARGSQIVAVEGAPDRFLMSMAELPGHTFGMIVTEAVPPSSYGFTTIAKPMLGRIVESHEHYSFTPLGAGSCRITLVNSVTFVDRMRLEHLGHEELMVSAGCHNALAKLKIQAEQGVDAVDAVADKLIV